jgi:hypothetical protein
MCSTVRNAKESYNMLYQVKALVPNANCTHSYIPDSAAHFCSLHNLAETCNGTLQPHLRSIGACTSVCNWHQCFDQVELVVALFCIFNSAAHIRGLSSFIYICSGPGRPYIQTIEACINVHDQCRPSSLLQSQTIGGCGVCRMLAELFFLNGARIRFSESTVTR